MTIQIGYPTVILKYTIAARACSAHLVLLIISIFCITCRVHSAVYVSESPGHIDGKTLHLRRERGL